MTITPSEAYDWVAGTVIACVFWVLVWLLNKATMPNCEDERKGE